jgi:hypothetical protein
MQPPTRPKTGGRKAGTPNKRRVDADGSPPAATNIFPLAGARESAGRVLPNPADDTPRRARGTTPAESRAEVPTENESAPSDLVAHRFPAYRIAKVAALIPYANNARTHSAAQIDKIAASIREFGFTNPVLTDGKRGIVAGHGRVLAAQQLGMRDVPIIELAHLSAAQRKAYIIADNKLALDAGWDEELLKVELGSLMTGGFDLALSGFDNKDLRELLLPIDEEKSTAAALSAGLTYQILIECTGGEDQQAELLEELQGREIKCRPLIL